MKVKEVFDKSIVFLRERGVESPRLETELLMSSILKTDRVGIYLKFEAPLIESEVSQLRDLVVRKSKGEPTAYLIGQKYFWNRPFHVGPGVLIPRPETEMIVELVIKDWKLNSPASPLKIADFGSGSGCLGITLGLEIPESQITMVERSSEAIKYLKLNINSLMSTSKVSTSKLSSEVSTEVFSEVSADDAPEKSNSSRFQLREVSVSDFSIPSMEEGFHIVVANPPYIDPADSNISPTVKKYEPAEALFTPDQGLADLKAWFQKAHEILVPGGVCYFEMGADQGELIKSYLSLSGNYRNIEVLQDFNKKDRIIKAVKNG